MGTDKQQSGGEGFRLQAGTNSVFLADEEQTMAFGRLLAKALSEPHGAVESVAGRLFLQGDLGAGKTTLVRGVLRGLGYQGAVKSPTYTLVEPYEWDGMAIYHFDLYRLSNPEEVAFLGVEDYLRAENLCLIEWPENGASCLPGADLLLILDTEGTGRRLAWQALTDAGRKIEQRLIELAAKSAEEAG
ncbi:MAG: tRNA (adenosine(37)-N6)-threonylcarbamoyltransferase complex ATPase subunit type 1 TsaE [Pseudomonadales bacterium]|nr:tRNA (adenosine(37)-N6)-threonylcarbamoyltransferase complex ATPase subunit type 1 TsaE [Pseudomonadales bacterium]